MQEVGHAALAIIPSFKGFQGDLERGSSKAMLAAGSSGGAQFGDAAGKSAASRFGSHVKSAAKIAAVGLAAAGAVAFKFAGDSLEEARDAQKVGALTDAVIKSTGRSAKVTATDVGKLSERLSNMAGVDDELIQSGANVLLTFTKIRNETGAGNKIFDEATKAALNMSAALKTDLSSSSIQVGKALNDPVKGVTALGRAGVQFTEDQKKAIEKMVETGDTLGAQKIILKELDTQFAGSAKSQATEADKLGVAFGNLKEDVGTELIPVMDDLAVFLRKKGIPAARDFGGWIRDDAAPAIKGFADDAVRVAKKVKPLVDLFGDLPTGGKIATIGTALAGGLTVKHQVSKIFDRGGIANPMFVVVTNPGGVVPGAPKGGPPKSALFSLGFAGVTGAATQLSNEFLASQIGRDNAVNFAAAKGSPGGGFGSPFTSSDFDDEKPAKIRETSQALRDFWLEGDKATTTSKRLGIETDANVTKLEAFWRKTDKAKDGTDRLRGSLDLLSLLRAKPTVDTTSMERAIEVANTLAGALRNATLIERGSDGGVNFQHGGTPDAPSGRAGVTNLFTGPIHGIDLNDVTRKAQRKTQRRALGGRP